MNIAEKKICLIQASWHSNIVEQFTNTFCKEWETKGGNKNNIDIVTTPGVLEIPLQAQFRAKTEKYDGIVVTGLIADEGIYRHEFVAQSVIENCMKVQMENSIPLIHSIMTPQRFFEPTGDHHFFQSHFPIKAKEACGALLMTLSNIEDLTTEI